MTGNHGRHPARSFIVTYWPIIVAIGVVVLASGRADSAIQQNTRDIASLKAEYPVIERTLGRIEGKLDAALGGTTP